MIMKILKVVLINMVAVCIKSVKLATPRLLKITVYWNKGYDVIISAQFFSSDSNYIANLIRDSQL